MDGWAIAFGYAIESQSLSISRELRTEKVASPPRLDLHKVPLQVYNMSTASERDNAALIRFVLPLTPAEVDCTMARFIKKGHERKGLHSDVRSKGWIPGRDSGQGGGPPRPSGALCARLAVAKPLDIDI